MTDFKQGDEVFIRATYLGESKRNNVDYRVRWHLYNGSTATLEVAADDVLAAPSALSDHDRAVVEAAKAWRGKGPFGPHVEALFDAVDAAIAAERPKTAEEVIGDAIGATVEVSGLSAAMMAVAAAKSLRSNPDALRQLLAEAEEGK